MCAINLIKKICNNTLHDINTMNSSCNYITIITSLVLLKRHMLTDYISNDDPKGFIYVYTHV